MTNRLSAFLGDVLGSPAGLREALGASLPEEATGIGRGRPIVLTGATVHVRLPRAAVDDDLVRGMVEPIVAELIAAELWARASSAPPWSGSGAGA